LYVLFDNFEYFLSRK